MKSLLLASFLGTTAGAFVLPALAGPIHVQFTQPLSFYGELPPGASQAAFNFGTMSRDFVLTDALAAYGTFASIKVTVNGSPVLSFPYNPNYSNTTTELHLNTGIFVRAGSQLALEATFFGPLPAPTPVTLIGYVQ